MDVIINMQDAEKHLINALMTHKAEHVLQCLFATQPFSTLEPEAFTTLFKKPLSNRHITVLYTQDGDIFIYWEGESTSVIQTIEDGIRSTYAKNTSTPLSDDFFCYYDGTLHQKELGIICKQKLEAQGESLILTEKETPKPPLATQKTSAVFSPKQIHALARQIPTRKHRNSPIILVVEDQAFSRKLLINVLSKFYTCYGAKDGEEAIMKYATYAPDIIFLDIELPDLNGHDLASLFRKTDPVSYLIMVTANNYKSDVEKAKNNQVQGFIIKPYNKQKILTSVENYLKLKKKGT